MLPFGQMLTANCPLDKCPPDKCPPPITLWTIALRTIALHCLEGIWLESIWQRAFGQRMESICLEGICPEGFFWRAIVKEHLAEGFCLGEQVEPNLYFATVFPLFLMINFDFNRSNFLYNFLQNNLLVR